MFLAPVTRSIRLPSFIISFLASINILSNQQEWEYIRVNPKAFLINNCACMRKHFAAETLFPQARLRKAKYSIIFGQVEVVPLT